MSRFLFNDENTLEDIKGGILVAQSWPSNSEDPPIAEQIDEIINRIEGKIARNKNRIRHNWLSTALDFAKTARASYLGNDLEAGYKMLDQCWNYLESGNKAHRRKTAFVVAPDGVVRPISEVTPKSGQ